MKDHIVDANKKVIPEWDAEGNPLNLQAAAEDAYEWLIKFSCNPMTADKRLKCARDELRKFLDDAEGDPEA